MMIFRPEGFLPEETRKRELHGGKGDMPEEELVTPEA
jgi:hypothetical protein